LINLEEAGLKRNLIPLHFEIEKVDIYTSFKNSKGRIRIAAYGILEGTYIMQPKRYLLFKLPLGCKHYVNVVKALEHSGTGSIFYILSIHGNFNFKPFMRNNINQIEL
jgi:hypothetical protein